MTEAPALPFLGGVGSNRAVAGLERESRSDGLDFEGVEAVEIVAPDLYSAALLVGYAAPSFLSEIVPGSAWVVRFEPSTPGGDWVVELLTLVRREWRCVTVAPFRQVVVESDQVRVRAHQVCEQPEQQPSADRQKQRERERQTGRRRRVEPRLQQGAQARMLSGHRADLAGALERRSGGRPRDFRVAPGEESDRCAGRQGECEQDEYRHGVVCTFDRAPTLSGLGERPGKTNGWKREELA